MSKITVTHPNKGFEGTLRGVEFKAGKAQVDKQKTVTLAVLKRLGCHVPEDKPAKPAAKSAE